MTTITSNKTGGIVLTSASYTNPVVVDPGVTISDANGDGILANSGSWTVVNSGSIEGDGLFPVVGAGVRLNAGGSVTNAASALISGGVFSFGVLIYGAAGTVVNSGTITGLVGGIDLGAGGSVTNAASASITGAYGVLLSAGGTVTNAGTITGAGGTGAGGTAVSFFGTASNRLVVDPGAVFNGKVIGSTSASNALELAAGGGAGTLTGVGTGFTGLGTSFTNFGTVTFDSGAAWTLSGTTSGAVIDDGTVTDAGSLSGGVTLGSGGRLTNLSGGVISNGGTAAVYDAGGPATVVNSGSIAGTGAHSFGVFLSAGGSVTGNSPNDTFVVYNSSDVVVPKAGSHDVVYAAASYTLPTGVDILILEASATQGVGNSDAAGDALYAPNPNQVATLTGNSANDTFVVYNAADIVVPKAGSHDLVYSAVNYALPTGVDQLILEAGTQAVGNSDAAGDTLYAANAGIAQTLTGNSHNDTFVVYNSGDAVVGQAGSTDTVYAAANFVLPTNVDTLFLEANASRGTGNSDAIDALFGNAGVASTLVAGSGADTLYVTGTAGTIMTGGAGHDTFAFPNVMGHDEVTNFGLAKDVLQFNATLFSNFTAAMNAASQSGANTVFTIDANKLGHAGQRHQEQSHGEQLPFHLRCGRPSPRRRLMIVWPHTRLDVAATPTTRSARTSVVATASHCFGRKS